MTAWAAALRLLSNVKLACSFDYRTTCHQPSSADSGRSGERCTIQHHCLALPTKPFTASSVLFPSRTWYMSAADVLQYPLFPLYSRPKVLLHQTHFRFRNDLYCVGWGVKLYSLTHPTRVMPGWVGPGRKRIHKELRGFEPPHKFGDCLRLCGGPHVHADPNMPFVRTVWWTKVNV